MPHFTLQPSTHAAHSTPAGMASHHSDAPPVNMIWENIKDLFPSGREGDVRVVIRRFLDVNDPPQDGKCKAVVNFNRASEDFRLLTRLDCSCNYIKRKVTCTWEYIAVEFSLGERKVATCKLLRDRTEGKTDLRGIDLMWAIITGEEGTLLDLTNIDFTEANFAWTKIARVDFSDTILVKATFHAAFISSSIFIRAVFSDSIFQGTSFNNLALHNDFSGVNLSGTIFINVDLSYSLFEGTLCLEAEFINVKFLEAILKSADCTLSRFRECDFTKAEIEDTIFDKASFTGTQFPGSDFSQTRYEGAVIMVTDQSGNRFYMPLAELLKVKDGLLLLPE